MIRDPPHAAVDRKKSKPITPFGDGAQLYTDYGVSTILVGGGGDYFDMADTVIAMENFQAQDVYQGAEIAKPLASVARKAATFWVAHARASSSLIASTLVRSVSGEVEVRDIDTLVFGMDDIDLSAVTDCRNRTTAKTSRRR